MQIVRLCDLYKNLIITLKYKIEHKNVFHVLFFSVAIIIERLNVKDFTIIKKVN